MRVRVRVVATVAALLVLAACGGGGDDGDSGGDGGPQPGTGTGWTVLAYVVADNDLEPFALDDLEEMVAAGSGEGLRIVAQVDRHPGYTRAAVPGVGDFTDARRLLVTAGGVETVETLGEPNMGDPATLADFVAWGIARYPAARYALVLWDHGASWLGFGVDETSGSDLLTLDEIERGVADGLSRAGLPRLDLLGFDACLMATWEVARTLSRHARYLVASEDLEPGHGWDYAAFAAARTNPQLAPDALGRELIDGFWDQAVARETSQKVTLSLVDLDRLGTLEGAMQQLPPFAAATGPIGRQRAQAIEYGRQPNPAQSMNMVDIGDLFAGLDASEFAAVKAEIDRGIGEAVLYARNGPLNELATGLSVYFPGTSRVYASKQSEYARYGEAASWRSFVEAYLTAADSAAPPSFAVDEPVIAETSPELVFGGPLVPGSLLGIAAATLHFGVPAQDDQGRDVGWWLYGEYPGAYGTADSGDELAVGSWDYQLLTLTQGSITDFGYLLLEEGRDGSISATIPFAYLDGPRDAQPEVAIWVIALDDAGAVLENVTYLIDSTGAIGQLAPQPGSLLHPLVQLVATDWSEGSFVMDPAATPLDATADISLDFVNIAPFADVYYAALWITNAAGAGDRLELTGTPP